MTSRRIRFGVRIHQGGYSYTDLRDVWREADRLGFYSATLYDLMNTPTLECWTTLSALASETSRIRLVPMVLANLYRHPAVLAKMAATLDVISNGRLELGIGAGGDEGDHAAFGLDFPDAPTRVAMLEESVDLSSEYGPVRPTSMGSTIGSAVGSAIQRRFRSRALRSSSAVTARRICCERSLRKRTSATCAST